MVRKKKEGNEVQRRAAAHRARHVGETPSEEHTTTGASKQRTHVSHRDSLGHAERTAHIHEGKQGSASGSAGRGGGRRDAGEQWPVYRGRGHPGYTEDHEQVYQALADAQAANGGDAVMLEEVARSAGRPLEETRTLMHDLTAVQGLATELQRADTPDLGPRYETRPGL